METLAFSALMPGPEEGTQEVIYLESIKEVQKLGRNDAGEIDFDQFAQVRDVIFKTLLAQDIADSYTGELAAQQAIAYAQTAAEAELICFVTSQTARETCNQVSNSCASAMETGGLSQSQVDGMMEDCLTKRTECYNAEQEAGDDEDADIPESCVEADKVCNESAVASCTEASRSCSIESVTESIDETGARSNGRVHAEVKRQCYADQTEERPASDDEEEEEG